MNLFELQERLKDFSQDQLVREMQAPTGTAPQFLVLSELQRRQRMMAEEQAQMPTPQTTVAEDAIAAAGMPQGGLADMARAMAPQTDMDMNTAVQPVERMRNGGVVRMQPGGLAGISRDLDVYSPTMEGARDRRSSRPRLVERNGIQYAEMPDGSLIAIGELGFSEADRAGADTADLAPRRGFEPPDTGPLPTQADLDQRFFEEQFGIDGGPLPPELSMANDVIMPGSDAAQNALGRIRPTQFVPARDMELPLVESLTGESNLDIRVPPSAASLGFGGSGFDIENLTEDQLEEYNSLTPEQQENVRLYGAPGPRPSDSTFGGATAAIEGALGPDPIPAPDMNMLDAIRAYEEFEQRGPKLQDILSGRAAVPGTFEAEAEAADAERVAADREAARAAEAARMMEINEIPETTRRVTDEGEIIAPPVVTPPDAGEDVESIVRGGGGAGTSAPAADDAFEQDKWLALAQAGLALMSSQQPTIGGAIGEAGLAGITALRQARGERDERISAQQARADRLAAAARSDREEAYPYRQVDDIISMADSYAQAAQAIVEANFDTPPAEGDPGYDSYISNLAMANVLRRRALALTGQE